MHYKLLDYRGQGEDDAKTLARLFAVDHDTHHAWYGQHEIFQPFAGK